MACDEKEGRTLLANFGLVWEAFENPVSQQTGNTGRPYHRQRDASAAKSNESE
jgi:hypothetical protein